jgi:tryptophanyl-tRNA synthetase
MSKSDPNDSSRINMTDDSTVIMKKIKAAKTDAVLGLAWDAPDRPECQNLLSLYGIVSGKSKEAIAAEVADMNWGQFKGLLADAAVQYLRPYQEAYTAAMADPGQLDVILKAGAEAANEVATETIERVRDAMGFLPILDAKA